MDPTVVGTNEWAAWQWAFLVDRAPWIAAWAALVVAKLLVFAIVLTALVPPAEYAAPADGVSTRAGGGPNVTGAVEANGGRRRALGSRRGRARAAAAARASGRGERG